MVEIPDDVAKHMAAYFRKIDVNGQHPDSLPGDRWADLLDPKPPTLREKVAEAIDAATLARAPHGYVMATVERDAIADAVLAAISDWLAAQPLMVPEETMRLGLSRPLTRGDQRAYDVRLLRGE
jgi:hypothetical protein